MVVEAGNCERPGTLFPEECIEPVGSQQCDYLCRIGEALLGGTCNNHQICYCASWASTIHPSLLPVYVNFML